MLTTRLRRACTALLAGALVALAAPQAGATTPVPDTDTAVRTQQGWVRGEATAAGRQFLGIPYAAPPVGALRWRAPMPVAPWSGVRDATDFGHRCVQSAGWDPGYEQPTHTEDCLNLNVYSPAAARSGRKLPVMVWLHGGGLTGGAGADVVPDDFAAKGSVVAVTLNYRLGAMGFLATPGLDEEAGDRTSGNFGMQDQQAALRWVRANIARFGGDPDQVTIAGESAGGRSVCTHLASPTARGLFHRAIIQSGAYSDCGARTRRAADADGTSFAASVGCKDPATATACLRRKPAKDILAAQAGHDWGPVTGGSFLPEQPAAAFASGRYAKVPVINGANRDEGTLFAFGSYDAQGTPLTAEQYPQALRTAYGPETGEKALARYPLADYPTPTLAYAATVGDQLMACPALRLDDRLGARTPVYAYEFADRTSPPFESLRNLGTDFPFGATHVNEVQYLFRHFGHDAPLNAEQRVLARQMTAYWTAFIRTGTPHVAGQPDLPDQRTAPGRALSLRTASAGGNAVTATLHTDHLCDLWDGAGQ
ncbi:carboxylesterase/lipase family protein [Streptomyces ochraceiscleroticus]|uniref:Carboxylic ester hydrolase n=1 Tax=Streptomyces ochraceiscleroticus TaxID=47761 RepID=A0ABW1MLL5_9ACTN|nr:carboxylesterase family protein [Streptomyces ochraceiscleroticus]